MSLYANRHHAMASEIDELRAALAGGEPVGWRNKINGCTQWRTPRIQASDYSTDQWQPLYTHPPRTLTDAEIVNVAQQTTDAEGRVVDDYVPADMYTPFARAIEAALKGQA